MPMVGVGLGDWKSQARDLMHQMGIGRKPKPKTADELAPTQLRAESERRARGTHQASLDGGLSPDQDHLTLNRRRDLHAARPHVKIDLRTHPEFR